MAYKGPISGPEGAERKTRRRYTKKGEAAEGRKRAVKALKEASALVGEELVLGAVPALRIAKLLKRFQSLTEKSARLRMARKIQQATKKHTAERARKGAIPPGGAVNKRPIKESEFGGRLIGDANKRVAAELRRAATARASKRVGLSMRDRIEVIDRKLATIGRVARMQRKEGKKLSKTLSDEAKALRAEHKRLSIKHFNLKE